MNQDTTTQNSANEDTLKRLRHLANVSRFLSTHPNDSTEESEYFIAKQALNDFTSELLMLPLDPQLKEDMRLFTEFLNTSLETKYQSHRR
jgi:hypothetical protein